MGVECFLGFAKRFTAVRSPMSLCSPVLPCSRCSQSCAAHRIKFSLHLPQAAVGFYFLSDDAELPPGKPGKIKSDLLICKFSHTKSDYLQKRRPTVRGWDEGGRFRASQLRDVFPPHGLSPAGTVESVQQ